MAPRPVKELLKALAREVAYSCTLTFFCMYAIVRCFELATHQAMTGWTLVKIVAYAILFGVNFFFMRIYLEPKS